VWNRSPQPLNLAVLGMPNCSAALIPGAVAAVLGAGGNAAFELTIPNQLGLVGLRFYNQAFIPDPQAVNPLGAVVSDAAEAIIGW
jgi:hypothetical protein